MVIRALALALLSPIIVACAAIDAALRAGQELSILIWGIE